MCKYCEDKKDDNRGGKFGCENGDSFSSYQSSYEFEIENNGSKTYLIVTDFKVADHVIINYCPMCGRKLVQDDR